MHDLKDLAYIQAPLLLYGLVLLLLDELFPCYSIHGLPFLWKLLILLQFTLILIPVCHDQSSLYSSSSPPRILKAFFSSLCSSCDISDNTSLFTSSTVARIGFCNAFPFSVNTTSINLRSSLLT